MEIEVNGKKIFLRSEKDGDFFFIHGAGCTSEVWKKQLRELGGYAIDLPNHGKSEDFEVNSAEDYAEVVKEVIEELGSFIVVGHSMGGAIAQALARRADLKGLVLLSTGAKLKVNPKLLEGLRNDFEGTVEKLVGWMFSKSYEGRKDREFVKNMIIGCRKDVVIKDFEICDKFDYTQDYEAGLKFDCEVLIAVGSDDVMTPVENSEYLRDKLNAKLAVINNSGHMVMLEKWKELNKVLKEFSESLR
ncbi:alpha/beta hydrolase fold protein [Ferroglobus placidus DSM 10642]|uniref:Alpha/beta hydrolase fold protein n=1 Tax=Ferroglobus placidus (strain DSM 10642 / AEDII12DO) TaxID=589924 RepID=D3S3I2_FERPA|nr:alpha/beta hydrolase [Ferroglobus placidus]ADC64815.1 alpha/beta hydrolase fold protein [Ferroglobus placidus DSM 10642]